MTRYGLGGRAGSRAGRGRRTEQDGETGILRIEFPKAPNHNDSALKEITWEEFFEKFDKSGLALVYQEVTREGAESNFSKLVHPENVSASAKKVCEEGRRELDGREHQRRCRPRRASERPRVTKVSSRLNKQMAFSAIRPMSGKGSNFMRFPLPHLLVLLAYSMLSAAARADSYSFVLKPIGEIATTYAAIEQPAVGAHTPETAGNGELYASISKLEPFDLGVMQADAAFAITDVATVELPSAAARAPEPSSLLLLGTGLVGAGLLGTFGAARRRVFGDAFALASFVRAKQSPEYVESLRSPRELRSGFGVPREQY